MSSTANKRSGAQIERDRAEIARLYLQGKTQVEIAGRVGVSQPMISYDLARVREAWRRSAVVDFNERVALELARLDNLELAAWEGWERSLEEHKSASRKTEVPVMVVDDDGQRVPRLGRATPIETIEKTERRVGDPRFLEIVHRCIDRRIKLLGVDAPKVAGIVDLTEYLPEGWAEEEVYKMFEGMVQDSRLLAAGD